MVSDRKIAHDDDTDGDVDRFTADVLSAQNYYAFGAVMDGMRYVGPAGEYRYGFNDQEKDDEISGSGNSYTAEYWQYDSRLGRRWNLDPVNQFNVSNYAVFLNNPIFLYDPDGREPLKWYQKFWNFVTGNRHINDAQKLAEKEGTQVHSILDGAVLIVPHKEVEGEQRKATAFIKGALTEDIDISQIRVQTTNDYFFEELTELINDSHPDYAKLLLAFDYAEEIEGEDLVVRIEGTVVIRPMEARMFRLPRFGSGTRNAVYARFRNGLPYIGKSLNILTRYSSFVRHSSNLRTIVSNIKDKNLLRAIEQRMHDYLKYEKGVKIDNQRNPMNAKDYAKYYDKVQEVLKGSNWKQMLDDIFNL